jgi:hypothetical protein
MAVDPSISLGVKPLQLADPLGNMPKLHSFKVFKIKAKLLKCKWQRCNKTKDIWQT